MSKRNWACYETQQSKCLDAVFVKMSFTVERKIVKGGNGFILLVSLFRVTVILVTFYVVRQHALCFLYSNNGTYSLNYVVKTAIFLS